MSGAAPLSLNTAALARARRALMRKDPVLGAVIRRVGPCGLETGRERDIFNGLVQAIVSQQLSTKAAATIHRRLLALLPDGAPTPAALARIPDEALRGVGLSRQKLSYIRDLSDKVSSGAVRVDSLLAREDEAIVEELTKIKGIGRWTVEMILIFRLARPDVFPVADLGIVRAISRTYNFRKTPDVRRLTALAEKWRPYRSVASWYLWASLENKA